MPSYRSRKRRCDAGCGRSALFARYLATYSTATIVLCAPCFDKVKDPYGWVPHR